MGKISLAGKPICDAVSDGNIEEVKQLIGNGSNVNLKYDGQPPILIATIKGHLEIMEYLIEKGANIKYKDKNGYTSFHHAAESASENNVDIFRKLIVLAVRKNVDGVNIKTSEKTAESRSPLHIAAIKGRVEIMKFLIEEKRADILAVDIWRKTALHLAIKDSPKIEATMYLIEKASSDLINAKDDNGDTPIHLAANLNNFEVLILLIARSASINVEARSAWINVQNKQGYTPLHFAARFCNVDVMNHLIENEALIEAKENQGRTPLHFAAMKSFENFHFLIKKGADDMVKDEPWNKIPRNYLQFLNH